MEKTPDPLPVFVAGPTAAGKSAVAMELAERIGGEIVSVDSMQVYRGLDIGTAKPSPAAQKRVPITSLTWPGWTNPSMRPASFPWPTPPPPASDRASACRFSVAGRGCISRPFSKGWAARRRPIQKSAPNSN